MKKFLTLTFTFVLALFISGCSQGASDEHTIVVGASVSPHAQILQAAAPALKKAGYDLEIREFSDYIQPNQALAAGELDANFFQHKPYLDDYNAQNNTDIVSVASIHFEPLKMFAGKCKNLKDISQGALIAVPSDATNEARALLLLQDQGLLTLNKNAGLSATVQDIEDNPYNLDIKEVEAAGLPRILPDCDLAVINGNYALSSGLDVKDVLAQENKESAAAQTYANIIAVRGQDLQSEKTQALIEALQTSEVRDFITNNFSDQVIATF